MRKLFSIFLSLVSVICMAFAFVGCGMEQSENGNENAEGGNETTGNGNEADYGEKEIAKIVTRIAFGEVMINYDPVRTFDFSSGTVTDTVTMSDSRIQYLLVLYNERPDAYPDYASAKEYESYLRTNYNFTEQVATFTEEQAGAFCEKIVSLGVYNWNDEYNNDSFTCGSWYYFTIKFTDGTQKATRFYDDYPSNYKIIENAFEEYFGTGIYCRK